MVNMVNKQDGLNLLRSKRSLTTLLDLSKNRKKLNLTTKIDN